MRRKAKAAPPAANTMTRAAVARVLGCSKGTVIAMERSGRLKPALSGDGTWLHTPAEVERVRREREHEQIRKRRLAEDDGVVAAAAFEMFEESRTLPEIVRALRRPPALIRELYDEWSTDLEGGAAEARARKAAAVELARQRAAALREERDRRAEFHAARLREMEARGLVRAKSR